MSRLSIVAVVMTAALLMSAGSLLAKISGGPSASPSLNPLIAHTSPIPSAVKTSHPMIGASVAPKKHPAITASKQHHAVHHIAKRGTKSNTVASHVSKPLHRTVAAAAKKPVHTSLAAAKPMLKPAVKVATTAKKPVHTAITAPKTKTVAKGPVAKTPVKPITNSHAGSTYVPPMIDAMHT